MPYSAESVHTTDGRFFLARVDIDSLFNNNNNCACTIVESTIGWGGGRRGRECMAAEQADRDAMRSKPMTNAHEVRAPKSFSNCKMLTPRDAISESMTTEPHIATVQINK